MFTIYKATNIITGKCYIGFDCNWPYRKSAHKCAVTRGSTLVFHNAIRRYGWENFQWEVLEQSEDGKLLLTEREEFYIRKFNSYYKNGKGYNMTFGGEGTFGWVPSPRTKNKISASKVGKPSWNKGKPSPWTAERNRNNAGKPRPGLEKTYKFIDPAGNEYVAKGLVRFCHEHGLPNAGNMSSVAKGKLKRYKGWTCTILSNT